MSEERKDLILTLRVYRGKVTYDEHGNLNSDNQVFKLAYGRLEWRNFIKSLSVLGYNKVDVVKAVDNSNPKEPKQVNVPGNIAKEIKVAMNGADKPLTPEQKEIAELKAQMADLIKGAKPTKELVKPSIEPVNNEKLNAARSRYEELYGKKPSHLMKLIGLEKKIEEKENETK